eukprot:1158329-Pelagomonas_calceolata.AAC.15
MMYPFAQCPVLPIGGTHLATVWNQYALYHLKLTFFLLVAPLRPSMKLGEGCLREVWPLQAMCALICEVLHLKARESWWWGHSSGMDADEGKH